MRLSFVRPHKSITSAVTDQDLPDFVVLSGLNGSGKSNLLESIQQGAIIVDGLQASPSHLIRLFQLAQLVGTSEGEFTASSYSGNWAQLMASVKGLVAEFTGPAHGLLPGSPQIEQRITERLTGQRLLTIAAIDKARRDAGKGLSEFSDADFRNFGPLLLGVRDPFAFAVGELFMSYHVRRNNNEYLQWQQEKKGRSEAPPLTDSEFLQRYGPPPWEVLDQTLRLVNLPYHFVPPTAPEENVPYQARLIEEGSSLTISTDQLSSGEKTLLVIAMTLFTGSNFGDAIELPHILLLDEADASLHPSMIRSLIQVSEEIFVNRYGVKVILTTHSPSTVALAPEESLYIMRRSGFPRVKHASSRDEALASLTAGLSTLSIKLENRRQVFVESEYDEDCYQELYRLLRAHLGTEISLDFIASGRGGQGNSNAVKHLVSSLRQCGNVSVWGILDRDQREGAGNGIVFMAERYALENLVLDPLVVGCFLIREGLVEPTALGLVQGSRHFGWLEAQRQSVIDAVVDAVRRDGDGREVVEVAYVGGFTHQVPSFYLDMQGHALEERLVDAFPALNRYPKVLKLTVVKKALGDIPDYIPAAVGSTFKMISS